MSVILFVLFVLGSALMLAILVILLLLALGYRIDTR